MKRAAIIIDGPNASASATSLGMRIDYKRVLDYFGSRFDLFRCLYVTALPPKTVHSDLRKLTDWVKDHGYVLVTKETRDYEQADGTMKVKGNMDVEISILTYEIAQHVDEIILFSGDGDFAFLVESIQRMGKRVTAVSSKSLISSDLRGQVDSYIDLDTLRNDLIRQRILPPARRPSLMQLLGSK